MLLALLLALETFEERRVDLRDGWRQTGSGWCVEFARPDKLANRHIRVVAPGAEKVSINGLTLSRPYDVTGLLGASNELCTDARTASLRVTPMVYIDSARVRAAENQVEATVSVRNTLDNTVNVAVALEGQDLSATATVPPGMTQDVVLRGSARVGVQVMILMDKDEEAMEGAYRYRTPVTVTR